MESRSWSSQNTGVCIQSGFFIGRKVNTGYCILTDTDFISCSTSRARCTPPTFITMMAARMRANGKTLPPVKERPPKPTWEVEKRKKQAALRNQKGDELKAKMQSEEAKVRQQGGCEYGWRCHALKTMHVYIRISRSASSSNRVTLLF